MSCYEAGKRLLLRLGSSSRTVLADLADEQDWS